VAVLTACTERPLPLEPVTQSEVLVLTQSADLVWYPLVAYRGPVVIDEAGCMRLGLTEPENATIVWPSGTTVWTRGDTHVLRDDRGREVLDLDGTAHFSGGFAAALEELTDLSLAERDATRERCPGPYWLVSEGTIRRGPS
jgi:hypothetical protein